nr:tape measure protein [uncultured Tolumonas sp.]
MANNNQSDIQLRITTAIDGLVEISKMITEVDKLGGQTSESSAEVDKLVTELDKLRQQDQLINQFQQLKKGTSELSGTLDDARTRATALGKGLSDSKAAVASTNSEYKASMSVTQQLSNEWVQAKAKVDLLSAGIKNTAAPTREQRDELKKAKDEAKALGEQYRASSKETTTLASALRSTESAVTKQTKEFNSARKEVNQLDAQYQKQNATLNSLRTAVQQTGISTTQLVSEQAKLKSATAQAEISVKNLSSSLKEQAALHRYLKENVDLSGAAFKQNAVESKKVAAAHTEASVSSNGFASTVSGLTSRLIAMAGAYVGINTITSAIKEMFSQGNQAELLQIQMNAVMGSIQAGEQATAWIQKFAKDTPLQLNEVTQAFTTMKSFGLDPMDGSLQAVVDESYKLGKGFEGVQRISLALGQAWAKQKLQGEEIMQLVEAGVPVWDLLAKATGKNTQELAALSEKGALGRDVIKQLMDEIAKGANGAAAANMGTLSGIISNAKDNIDTFYRSVSNSGSLDWLKKQLQSVNDQFAKMAADGSLKVWAKEISNDIVSVGESIKTSAKKIYEWRDTITAVGKAWLGLKVAGWINDVLKFGAGLKNVATGIESVASKAPLLALLSNPISMLVATLGIAGKLAHDLAIDFAKLTEGQEIKNRIAEQERALNQQLLTQGNELMAQNAQNKDLQYQSADVIKYLSDTDRERYKQALEGNKNYLAGQLQVNAALENAGLLTDEQKQQTQFATSAMRQAFADFAAGEQQHLAQASKSIDDYVADIEHAKSVAENLANTSLTDVFKTAGLDFDQISGRVGTTVQTYVNGLQQMAQSTSVTGIAINAYLLKAFDSTQNKAELDALIAKVDTLHNQGKLVGDTYISSLGAAATAAKSFAVTNTESGQVYIDLLKQQKAAADEAYKTTGLEQYKLKAGELNLEIDKLTKNQQKNATASNDLEQSFSDLGMKSAATLEGLATKAETAYNRMATSGTSSLNQQREAFLKYAEAEIQAADASGRMPSAMLQSQAAALGLTSELDALNTRLTTVGGESLIAAGALNQLGSSAQDTGKKVASVGSATEGTVKSVSAVTPLVVGLGAETKNLGKASEYAGMSVKDLAAEVDKQSAVYAHTLSLTRDLAGERATRTGDWLYGIEAETAATNKYNLELAQATLEVKNLQKSLSESPSDVLINRAEQAIKKHKALGEENLSGLRSAIDSARSKMESLNASTQSTLNSLRDQADELNNNTAAIENRRYQTEVAELEAKLAEAQKLRNTQSIADMKESLRLAQEIHNKKMATIQAEKTASASASSSTNNASNSSNSAATIPQTSSKTVTVNLKTGSTITPVQVIDESQADALLSALQQVGLRTA